MPHKGDPKPFKNFWVTQFSKVLESLEQQIKLPFIYGKSFEKMTGEPSIWPKVKLPSQKKGDFSTSVMTYLLNGVWENVGF